MRFLLIIIFCCVISFSGSSQSIDSLFRLADLYYQDGKWDRAVLLYEKINYLSDSTPQKYNAIYRKAICYKKIKEYGKAFDELQQIVPAYVDDSLGMLVLYERALNSYLAANYAEVEACYYIWKSLSFDSNQYLNALIWLRLLAYNESQQWDKAYQLLNEYFPIQGNDSDLQRLYQLYQEPPKLRNPEKARILSSIVPGAGQLYAGYPGEAVYSFLLNASMLTLSAVLFYHKYYLTAWLGGLGLLWRFYSGGSRRAYELCKQKNLLNTTNYNHQLSRVIVSLMKKPRQ